MKLREALARSDEIRTELVESALDLLDSYDLIVDAARKVAEPVRANDDLASAIEVFRKAGYRNKGLAVLLRLAVEAFMDSRWSDRNETK